VRAAEPRATPPEAAMGARKSAQGRGGRLLSCAAVLVPLLAAVLAADLLAGSDAGRDASPPGSDSLPVPGTALVIVSAPSLRLERIEEDGRAGSLAAYLVSERPRSELPSEQGSTRSELQLHTIASIAAFDVRCRRRTGYADDDSCWEGWRPHRDDLEREKRALLHRSQAEACGEESRCTVVTLAGRPTIARTRPRNDGAERELVWFVADVRVSLVSFALRADTNVEPRAAALAAKIAVRRRP
jgi:hypothetical protein